MTRFIGFVVFLFFFTSCMDEQKPFVTTWKTDNPGISMDNQITIPGIGNQYTINWEEVGNPANNGTLAASGVTTIDFPSAGTYRISISGDFNRLWFNNGGDRLKLLSIEQWGDIEWSGMAFAFWGCENLTYAASDAPDLSEVTSMMGMFRRCTHFDGNLNNWDVSSVTNMFNLFEGATYFNGDISEWDVSSVTNMQAMFSGAAAFNQPIGDWDVSSVTNMVLLFSGATSFNQPLNNWDVSSVTNMQAMFSGAAAFNQSLENWDVSSVTNTISMFSEASSFNQPIGDWDVSSVANMTAMFNRATAFNQLIAGWDVSSVVTMRRMFIEARSFNQPIGDWDVSSVTSMNSMFRQTGSFDQPIDHWDISSVLDMQFMFMDSEAFNQPLENWDVSSVIEMGSMFSRASAFDQNLGAWQFNESVNLRLMLNESGLSCEQYDNALVGWNENPKTPANLELGARSQTYYRAGRSRDSLINEKGWAINGDKFNHCIYMAGRPFVTVWKSDHPGESEDNEILIPATGHKFKIDWEEVGNPENSGSRLAFGETLLTFPHPGTYKVSIKGHLSRITFSKLKDHQKIISIEQWGDISWYTMDRAFYGCNNLIYNALDTPDLSRVTSMYSMFRECPLFDGDLSGWDVSNVTDMGAMFNHAHVFNGDISDWNVSNVESMIWMFNKAYKFNQPIGKWDVSSATDIHRMFSSATSFNQPLEDWNVSSVKVMVSLFSDAISFNQPVESWDVSSVENMSYLFLDASSFNQSLGSWVFHKDVNTASFLYGTNISCENYDKSLIGWNANPLSPDSLVISSGHLHYWLGENAIDSLRNVKGWRIGGRYTECNYLCDLPLPIINYEGNLNLCEGDSTLLYAQNPDFEFHWIKNGEVLYGESGQVLIVKDPGNYTLMYLDEEGCESEESESVEITFLNDTGLLAMTNARDTVLMSASAGCEEGVIDFEAEIMLCSGTLEEIEKKSHWRIDLFNTGQFDIVSTDLRPDNSTRDNLIIAEELPLGTHRVRWELIDAHGNLTIEEHLITLLGPNPPIPVCLYGIVVSINPSSGQVSLPASVFDRGSWDDCTDSEDLIFSYSSDPAHTHHTWSCEDLDGMTDKIIEVEMWVTNSHGHQNHCMTFIRLQDNRESCLDIEENLLFSNPAEPTLENGSRFSDFSLWDRSDVDSDFRLFPNSPNPFREQTHIGFKIPKSSSATLRIFHSSGRLIGEFTGEYPAGYHEFSVRKSDLNEAGMYFYRLETDEHTQTGRMVLME